MNSGVPIAVQQIVESMLDKSNPSHVRFNNKQVVESIKEYCEKSLNAFNKQSLTK